MIDSKTTSIFQAMACSIEAEVARGRTVEDVLALGQRHKNNLWFNPNILRHFSPAVAKAFPNNAPLSPTREATVLDEKFLALAQANAAVIDREVASGRRLSDVLAVNFSGGQRIWAELARPYSMAMSAA